MSEPSPAQVAAADFGQRRHFANLDGLRAISILAVLWHHTVNELPGLPGAGRGFLGVDMFFGISGFLIVTLLLRERDRSGTISLPKFYARRTLRIFPLYYLVVGIVGILCLASKGSAFSVETYVDTLPYYLTYTLNWYPGGEAAALAVAWSLAAEEQFYLLWPPIERYARKLAVPVMVVALAYNQAINFEVVPMPFGLERLEHPILQATFTPILLGVGLAHLLHTRAGFVAAYRLVGHRWSAAGLVALTVIVGNVPNEDIGGAHRLALQLLMVLCLAAVVVREDGVGGRMLRHPVVVRIGQISYGLYLWHMIVRAFAFAALAKVGLAPEPGSPSAFVLFALVLAGTWGVSEASFRFFETPILRLKKRFST